jgi:hypothetical protein
VEQNGWERRRSWLHDSKWRARARVSVRLLSGGHRPSLRRSLNFSLSLFLPTFSVCFAKRKANDEAKDRRVERKEFGVRVCVRGTHKGRTTSVDLSIAFSVDFCSLRVVHNYRRFEIVEWIICAAGPPGIICRNGGHVAFDIYPRERKKGGCGRRGQNGRNRN